MNTASTDFNDVWFGSGSNKIFADAASTTDFTISASSVTVITPEYLSISGDYTNNLNGAIDTAASSTVINFNGSSWSSYFCKWVNFMG